MSYYLLYTDRNFPGLVVCPPNVTPLRSDSSQLRGPVLIHKEVWDEHDKMDLSVCANPNFIHPLYRRLAFNQNGSMSLYHWIEQTIKLLELVRVDEIMAQVLEEYRSGAKFPTDGAVLTSGYMKKFVGDTITSGQMEKLLAGWGSAATGKE